MILINRILDSIKDLFAFVPKEENKHEKIVHAHTSKFNRDGKVVFLDLIRDIFVLATKEEHVRQDVLLRLLNDWQIPKKYIEVEKNMSYYKSGARDRADIIVLHPESGLPFILFEIKAPDVFLSDDTKDQALRYNQILNCDYICLTNQTEECWFSNKHGGLKLMEKPGDFKKLLASKIKFIEEKEIERLTLKELNNVKRVQEYCEGFYIAGEDTPPELRPFIANFYGMLLENKKHIVRPVEAGDMKIIDDGIRSASFGNAAGGNYDGTYRYYIVEFANGDHNIVSFSIFGTEKSTNDPHWGSRNSYTSLVVAIDDFEKKHNSLQLNLDNNLVSGLDSWKIFHEGKLTIGKKGAIKIARVLEFCRESIPDMVQNDQIFIGELPKNELFVWDNCNQVIINLIKYAIVRDKIRNTLQGQ